MRVHKQLMPNKLLSQKIFYFVCVPLLIFMMHLSWGTGFLVGFFAPKSNDL